MKLRSVGLRNMEDAEEQVPSGDSSMKLRSVGLRNPLVLSRLSLSCLLNEVAKRGASQFLRFLLTGLRSLSSMKLRSVGLRNLRNMVDERLDFVSSMKLRSVGLRNYVYARPYWANISSSMKLRSVGLRNTTCPQHQRSPKRPQ